MEKFNANPEQNTFKRKNNLTVLKTTINPTSHTLRKVLKQKAVKMVVISNNAFIAQLAYNHIQEKKGEQQLIWAPKTNQTTLMHAIPNLPSNLSSVCAVVLSEENTIAALLQADDPVNEMKIAQLYNSALKKL